MGDSDDNDDVDLWPTSGICTTETVTQNETEDESYFLSTLSICSTSGTSPASPVFSYFSVEDHTEVLVVWGILVFIENRVTLDLT